MTTKKFEERIGSDKQLFHRVVPFLNTDRLLLMDFTQDNTELTPEVLKNTDLFIHYINRKLNEGGARYGIGGYAERRMIYARSELFGQPIPSPSRREGSMISDAGSLSSENKALEEPDYGYHWADPFYYKGLKEFAIQHRSKPTVAEEILWKAVKAKKLHDYKFKRQHIIGKYITDLVCLDKRLIIEIDGLIHQLPENIQSDAARSKSLEEKGFTVIRVTNQEVLNELNRTLENILRKLNDLPSIKSHNDLSPPFGRQRASPFGAQGALREIHLGIDIWGKPYTRVMAPLDGIVHSFAFNNAFGDYGTTIILSHQLHGFTFHTLYGHLSLNSITNIREGDGIKRGDVFASFGIPYENGHWPPHLHFQIIIDMKGMKGDYPGVCAASEKQLYLENSPDPDVILQMMQFAGTEERRFR